MVRVGILSRVRILSRVPVHCESSCAVGELQHLVRVRVRVGASVRARVRVRVRVRG